MEKCTESEVSFEDITRALHARDPKSMIFTGHAVVALDEVCAKLAAANAEIERLRAQVERLKSEMTNSQLHNACE